MIIAISQDNSGPSYDIEKADMFALGIILIERIFQESLSEIFDYDSFEIKLNPLLEKIQGIKEQFGEEVAGLFIAMLEVEEEDRIGFEELRELSENLLRSLNRNSAWMLASNQSQRNDRQNRTPRRNNGRNNISKGKYRNDVSPLRGRFGSNVKVPERSGRTPEARNNRSPLRRDAKVRGFQGMGTNRQNYSPMRRWLYWKLISFVHDWVIEYVIMLSTEFCIIHYLDEKLHIFFHDLCYFSVEGIFFRGKGENVIKTMNNCSQIDNRTVVLAQNW